MSDQVLLSQLRAAIGETTAALRRAYPTEELAGYALCTDDGVETLFYLATTREVLSASTDPDLLFTPTDWTYDPGAAAFQLTAKYLRHRADAATDFHRHVDSAFAGLVEALSRARDDGCFDGNVFLSVLSTDPSAHLEQLEAAAIARLNKEAILVARQAFLSKWR
jgi:hypothetical protein